MELAWRQNDKYIIIVSSYISAREIIIHISIPYLSCALPIAAGTT